MMTQSSKVKTNGPSKHQFDTLHENEEIVSLSGITAPINMKDADDELKKLLKKFLGNDADNWQDVINEGSIMILNVLHLMLSLPPNTSKTSFIHPLFLRRHLKCMVPVHHL